MRRGAVEYTLLMLGFSRLNKKYAHLSRIIRVEEVHNLYSTAGACVEKLPILMHVALFMKNIYNYEL